MQVQGPRLVIRGLAAALPARRVGNEELAARFPAWEQAGRIAELTGIRERRYAAPGQTAADLAAEAAGRLFAAGLPRQGVDFLILCTETPDYLLPATACALQDRLGLPAHCAAFDLNLGCSGWVYSLAVAQGFLSAGLGRAGLVVTADVISPYLNPRDRATVLLFGDGAAATYVEAAADGSGLSHLDLGTDGSGLRHLLIPAGGARLPRSAATAQEVRDASGNWRSHDQLAMNGPEVLTFTLRRVPASVQRLLDEAGWAADAVDLWVFHQASKLVLDALQRKFRIPEARLARRLEDVGNTVGSALPLALEAALRRGRLRPGDKLVLSGFGVGLSWASALMTWGEGPVSLGAGAGDI